MIHLAMVYGSCAHINSRYVSSARVLPQRLSACSASCRQVFIAGYLSKLGSKLRTRKSRLASSIQKILHLVSCSPVHIISVQDAKPSGRSLELQIRQLAAGSSGIKYHRVADAMLGCGHAVLHCASRYVRRASLEAAVVYTIEQILALAHGARLKKLINLRAWCELNGCRYLAFLLLDMRTLIARQH